MQMVLPGGIYPPLPTFFDAQEELDFATLQRHILRLAPTGIAGYVLLGSTGEAVHLTDDEREQVLLQARATITASKNELPIIVGCSAQSTRVTLAYCEQAQRCGADFVLVLPPFYYRSMMDARTVLAHYRFIADHSPLPVILYNMPACAAGLDLGVETVLALAEHPNIVGMKDSSGNVAKMAQIVAQADPTFRMFTGTSDVLLPTLIVGGVGAVTALGNIFPRTIIRVQQLLAEDKLEEARLLQGRLIAPNVAVTATYGIAGLKLGLEYVAGYGGLPRLPLHALSPQDSKRLREIISVLPVED